MSVELIALLGLAGAGLYFGNKNKLEKQLDSCIVNKITAPLEGVFNTFYSNKGLIVDYVNEESVTINTPFKELYGVRIVGDYNVAHYVDNNTITKLSNDYKKDNKGFFWYVIQKQGFFQNQYIFTYNKEIAEEFADYYATKLLSGNELANVLLDLYLKNYYWIEDKKVHKTIDIDFSNNQYESSFRVFNKIAKENIHSNLNQTDLFQAYKMLDIKNSNIQALLNLTFDGAIWCYFDLTEKAVVNHLDLLVMSAKTDGNSKHFRDLKDNYVNGNIDLILSNTTAHISNYSKRIIGNMSSALKNDFIRKDINRIETLRKTPLKYRDIQFDYLAPLTHLNNFISSVHKRTPSNPDIFGFDKNGSFISYSFTEENDAPHFMIIGSIGTGKSFQKQIIMSQIINLDFNTMVATYEKNGIESEIRAYDVGFSDELFVKLLAQKPENGVVVLSSKYGDFAYNLCNIDFSSPDTREADLTFQSELISLILSAKGGEVLNIGESELFKTTLEKIYKTQDFREYMVSDIENSTLKEKILKNKDYTLYTRLLDLTSEYDFLKTPLLRDVVNYCSIQARNEQITEEQRHTYKTLELKLDDVDKMKIFSKFDEEDMRDIKFLSMDLNDFKESDLFVPIFTCIFQKRYLRDRERAIECRRRGVRSPKVFVMIEEVKNYFRVPYFSTMLEKIALEARKYNVHLGLIGQLPSHIPSEIAKVIDTKIFLLKKDKKQETIKDIKDRYLPDDLVIEQLQKTDRFEMCVWYQKGAFNLKFEVTEKMHNLFNTNMNLINTKEESENNSEEVNNA